MVTVSMRMLADSARGRGRLEDCRTGEIQQQKRADLRAERAVVEQRADREAVAHPMLIGIGVGAENFLHLALRD